MKARWLLVILCALLVSVGMTCTGDPTPYPQGQSGTWNLVFNDDFNGSSLDTSKWATTGSWECCDGGRSNAGNGELDYKRDENITQDFGMMTITAKRETFAGKEWTSGQIATRQSFTYAYVEARMRLADPKGFLNALWTWGSGANAPAQETDVFEFYSDNHARLYLTSHAAGGGGCQGVTLAFDPTLDLHTYGADIRANGTDFYIDGQRRCSAAGHPTGAWNVIDYMTVNAASRAPVADASTTHAEMVTDYVRVWTR